MPPALLVDAPPGPSRILIDLAEGRLDEDELDALTAWLSASGPGVVPERLIQFGLDARR